MEDKSALNELIQKQYKNVMTENVQFLQIFRHMFQEENLKLRLVSVFCYYNKIFNSKRQELTTNKF
jgi:hypothetical protein